jgi:hypothetical protein
MTTAPKLPEGLEPVAWLFHGGPMDGQHARVPKLRIGKPSGSWPVCESLVRLSDAQAALQAQAAEKDAEIAALKLQLEAGPLYSTRLKAKRYELLRRGQQWSVINGIGDTLRADDLDAAIDSALLAAKEAKQ